MHVAASGCKWLQKPVTQSASCRQQALYHVTDAGAGQHHTLAAPDCGCWCVGFLMQQTWWGPEGVCVAVYEARMLGNTVCDGVESKRARCRAAHCGGRTVERVHRVQSTATSGPSQMFMKPPASCRHSDTDAGRVLGQLAAVVCLCQPVGYAERVGQSSHQPIEAAVFVHFVLRSNQGPAPARLYL